MNRLLLTQRDKECPFRCRYCFAKFSQYSGTMSLETVESHLELAASADIIYPACDVDLFAMGEAIAILWRTAKLGKHISVSTKAHVADRLLPELTGIGVWMREQGKVLKVGVSLSTSNSINLIEPGTSSYTQRLHNLKLLADAGIPRALVLKPVLAEVPLAEYAMILNDAKRYTDNVLIGDEYVDQLNLALPDITNHVVNWLPGQPVWPMRRADHRDGVINAAKLMDYQIFMSDLDLMCSLVGHEDIHSSTA